MKLLQIAPCYVDLGKESGGVANVVRELCFAARDAGIDVILACGNRELSQVKARPGTTVVDGIRVHVLDQRASPALGPGGAVRELIRRETRTGRSTVAHVHTCFSVFSESAMSELAAQKTPFIFSPHGKLADGMLKRHRILKSMWWKAVSQRRVRTASACVALAGAEERELRFAGYEGRIVQIPNGYRELGFGSAPLDQAGPYILYLGYLDPRKRPELLIKAFARCNARASHRLVIAGPDKYGMLSRLRQVARDCHVEDQVEFPGGVFGEDKWSLLRGASVFCLPSTGEGLPVALCEALGAGTPSLFTSACNFPEIAVAGAGTELDVNADADEWAKGLDDICLQPVARRHMAEAADKLRHHYSWKSVTDRWILLYRDLEKQF